MQHQAINPTYQRAIERLYKADRKFCELVDGHQAMLDQLDPHGDRWHEVAERIETKQAERFDTYVERYIDEPELPKRELEAFTKSYVAFHGYTPYLV